MRSCQVFIFSPSKSGSGKTRGGFMTLMVVGNTLDWDEDFFLDKSCIQTCDDHKEKGNAVCPGAQCSMWINLLISCIVHLQIVYFIDLSVYWLGIWLVTVDVPLFPLHPKFSEITADSFQVECRGIPPKANIRQAWKIKWLCSWIVIWQFATIHLWYQFVKCNIKNWFCLKENVIFNNTTQFCSN